jgi:glycolate oxidase
MRNLLTVINGIISPLVLGVETGLSSTGTVRDVEFSQRGSVKLRPLQDPQRTIAGYFDSVVDAGRPVSAVAAAGLTPSALELVDRQCLLAVDAWKNMGLSVDANAVLLGRVDTADPAGEQEAQKMRACFEEAGATWSAVSTDQEEANALFAARRLAYPAMERLGPVLTEAVCVPTRRVAEMFSRIERIGVDYGITIANIAHAGDGNLHPLLNTPRRDDAARVRAQAAFAEIIEAAPEFVGTVTGEHGVGLLKMDGLAKELDPVEALKVASLLSRPVLNLQRNVI